MKPAVTLQTKFGYDYYNNIFELFNYAKKENTVSSFNTYACLEKADIEKEILTLLDNPVMIKKYKMDDDDSIGWNIYKELSDMYSTLNHFSTRK